MTNGVWYQSEQSDMPYRAGRTRTESIPGLDPRAIMPSTPPGKRSSAPPLLAGSQAPPGQSLAPNQKGRPGKRESLAVPPLLLSLARHRSRLVVRTGKTRDDSLARAAERLELAR
jgi:hypothetical protein